MEISNKNIHVWCIILLSMFFIYSLYSFGFYCQKCDNLPNINKVMITINLVILIIIASFLLRFWELFLYAFLYLISYPFILINTFFDKCQKDGIKFSIKIPNLFKKLTKK